MNSRSSRVSAGATAGPNKDVMSETHAGRGRRDERSPPTTSKCPLPNQCFNRDPFLARAQTATRAHRPYCTVRAAAPPQVSRLSAVPAPSPTRSCAAGRGSRAGMREIRRNHTKSTGETLYAAVPAYGYAQRSRRAQAPATGRSLVAEAALRSVEAAAASSRCAAPK